MMHFDCIWNHLQGIVWVASFSTSFDWQLPQGLIYVIFHVRSTVVPKIHFIKSDPLKPIFKEVEYSKVVESIVIKKILIFKLVSVVWDSDILLFNAVMTFSCLHWYFFPRVVGYYNRAHWQKCLPCFSMCQVTQVTATWRIAIMKSVGYGFVSNLL